MKSIRYCTRTGRPFGSEEFVKSMEKKLDRRFMLKLQEDREKRAANKIWDVSLIFYFNRISLKGGELTNRKDGYAEWQLLEDSNA